MDRQTRRAGDRRVSDPSHTQPPPRACRPNKVNLLHFSVSFGNIYDKSLIFVLSLVFFLKLVFFLFIGFLFD